MKMKKAKQKFKESLIMGFLIVIAGAVLISGALLPWPGQQASIPNTIPLCIGIVFLFMGAYAVIAAHFVLIGQGLEKQMKRDKNLILHAVCAAPFPPSLAGLFTVRKKKDPETPEKKDQP